VAADGGVGGAAGVEARVEVGVSVGAARVGPDGAELRVLLRVADQRMYDAKRRARRVGR
jgi:GGDEF domain-containing protein